MLSRVANNLFWMDRYMERSYGLLNFAWMGRSVGIWILMLLGWSLVLLDWGGVWAFGVLVMLGLSEAFLGPPVERGGLGEGHAAS